MDQTQQKWMNVSFIAVAALVYYLLYASSSMLSGYFDLETKVSEIDLILRGVSVFLGFVTFAVLKKHPRVNQYTTEVVSELSKVTWPTHKETVGGTIYVMILVIVSALFLGFVDYIWANVIQKILGL